MAIPKKQVSFPVYMERLIQDGAENKSIANLLDKSLLAEDEELAMNVNIIPMHREFSIKKLRTSVLGEKALFMGKSLWPKHAYLTGFTGVLVAPLVCDAFLEGQKDIRRELLKQARKDGPITYYTMDDNVSMKMQDDISSANTLYLWYWTKLHRAFSLVQGSALSTIWSADIKDNHTGVFNVLLGALPYGMLTSINMAKDYIYRLIGNYCSLDPEYITDIDDFSIDNVQVRALAFLTEEEVAELNSREEKNV